MADAERDAVAKGEPLPKAAGRIRSNDIPYDDSKAAEIERERARLPKMIELAEAEDDPAQKSEIMKIAHEIKTKIANYEKTSHEKTIANGDKAEQVRP